MKYNKIFKTLLVLFIIIYFRGSVSSKIVSINLEVTNSNLFWLTFLYLVELLILSIIYDYIIIFLYNLLSMCISTLGKSAIKNKRIKIALFTIRLNYYLLKSCRFLRIGVLTNEAELNIVWLGLTKQKLSEFFLNTVKFFISIHMVLSFFFASLSLGKFELNYSYYLQKIQNYFKISESIKWDMGAFFTKLPSLVALITLVPIIFFFYFYSRKREVRNIIDKNNSRYFEEVVLLFESLMLWIEKHIYEIAENFDDVINKQDLIVDLILKKEIPNYDSLYDNSFYNRNSFIEIKEIKKVEKIVNKLTSDRLKRFVRSFSVKKYDIWYLYYFEFSRLKSNAEIEKLFYTQKGIDIRVNERSTFPVEFTTEQIKLQKKKEVSILAWSIYNDLELLYKLNRACDSLKSYLYSSRIERIIIKTLKKK